MGMIFQSLHQNRRSKIMGHQDLTGIDYLEVRPDQHELHLHFIPSTITDKETIPADIAPANIKIEGGVRISNIRVDQVVYPDPEKPGAKPEEKNKLTIWVKEDGSQSEGVGDFSTYTLSLVNVNNVDPLLSKIDFSFKINCPRDFDCKTDIICQTEGQDEPQIDYQSKDYASFRRLMLDRLAITMPGWKERNPADLGIAIIEVLAYAADHLSYYQDAVATEAYLGTARRRASVRRHARLLDYPMHDGCNSRVWIAIDLDANSYFDGKNLHGPGRLNSGDIQKPPALGAAPLWPLGERPGDAFLTRVDGMPLDKSLNQVQFEEAISKGAQVFEILHDLTLRSARSRMDFYTWGEDQFCLPRGATSASLSNKGKNIKEGHLGPGDVLIFVEVKGPTTGDPNDADRSHRHVVRLTGVDFNSDLLLGEDIIEIQWDGEDALPFTLCVSNVALSTSDAVTGISVAIGNVALADHGHTVLEILESPPTQGHNYPRLQFGPLAQQGHARNRLGRQVPGSDHRPATFDPSAPAGNAMLWQMRDSLPAVKLADLGRGQLWLPQRDLLGNDRFALDFVAETEEDGSSSLRFGDNICGMRLRGELTAIYRIGNGREGNIGAGSIAHVFLYPLRVDGDRPPQNIRVCNPLPARGGQDPEPIDQVRLYAPQAFRKQERAVNENDYSEVAQRHPDVQRAIATRRWTGSWHTMFITVDRKGGQPIDRDFEDELITFLEGFGLAGMDLEIVEPLFVPLEILLTICVTQGYFQSDIEEALLEAFSSKVLADGRPGFFHPDNFTFNQDLYLSRVISLAMEVPGVKWVDASNNGTNLFQRQDQPSRGEIISGVIEMGLMEILRLDNDPSNPENGRIRFSMVGGQ
jgi:hypothetical protein